GGARVTTAVGTRSHGRPRRRAQALTGQRVTGCDGNEGRGGTSLDLSPAELRTMDDSFDCPLVQADARTDAELVRADVHDDANKALRALELRYSKRLHHFVHGLVRDTHLAADVTQEVLEKAYLKNHLYAPGTSFRAWLFEVARNQALSALRKQRRQPRP